MASPGVEYLDLPDDGGLPVLVGFPYAGGLADTYRRWLSACEGTMDFAAVHLPGRLRRPHLQAVPTFAEAATQIAAEIAQKVRTDRPLLLFGHSMGAMLAYATARALSSSGHRQADGLVVSGCPAPDLWSPRETASLTDEDLLDSLRRWGGTPPEVLEHDDLRQLVLDSLRLDLELCQTFDHSEAEPLACPIAAYTGREDEDARPQDVLDWRRFTPRWLGMKVEDGGHFALAEPHAGVSEQVLRMLGEARVARRV